MVLFSLGCLKWCYVYSKVHEFHLQVSLRLMIWRTKVFSTRSFCCLRSVCTYSLRLKITSCNWMSDVIPAASVSLHIELSVSTKVDSLNVDPSQSWPGVRRWPLSIGAGAFYSSSYIYLLLGSFICINKDLWWHLIPSYSIRNSLWSPSIWSALP